MLLPQSEAFTLLRNRLECVGVVRAAERTSQPSRYVVLLIIILVIANKSKKFWIVYMIHLDGRTKLICAFSVWYHFDYMELEVRYGNQYLDRTFLPIPINSTALLLFN